MQTPKYVDEIIITVQSLRMKRITGWETACNSCGHISLARNKRRALESARDHSVKNHRGTAYLRT